VLLKDVSIGNKQEAAAKTLTFVQDWLDKGVYSGKTSLWEMRAALNDGTMLLPMTPQAIVVTKVKVEK
jgi:hypothetical protein